MPKSLRQTITQEEYDNFVDGKQNGRYVNKITSGIRCALGKTKDFYVEGTSIVLTLTCTQSGGMVSGTHCFILK